MSALPFADALLRTFSDRPRMLELTKRVVADVPAIGADRYSDEELDQLLNAFEALVTEAVTGAGTSTRELVLETAIPAIVADGLEPWTLACSNTTFAIFLTGMVLEEIPPEQRVDALSWLASFWGSYTGDVVRTAMEAAP